MDRVTEAQKIRNFIQYHRKPFTQENVATDTGCNKHTITRVIRELELSGSIKSNIKTGNCKVYTRCTKNKLKRSGASISPETALRLVDMLHNDWNFIPSKETARIIRNHLQCQVCGYDTVNNMAALMNMSPETVQRYVNVLECLGAVRRESGKVRWIKHVEIPKLEPYHKYREQFKAKKDQLDALSAAIHTLKAIRRQKEKERMNFLLTKVFV